MTKINGTIVSRSFIKYRNEKKVMNSINLYCSGYFCGYKGKFSEILKV